MLAKRVSGRRAAWLMLAVCFVLATPVSAWMSVARTGNGSLFNCYPFWNDEVIYWNEIACFARVGFEGGYFVADERPAPARWCHFGPHGPGFPIIYGLAARVFGWETTYGSRFNVAVLILAAVAWLCLCRPDFKRLALATFLLATFWPCIYHVPTMMQESLHFGIALLLAGLIHQGLKNHTKQSRNFVSVLLAVAVASMIRITWCLVLIPYALTALSGVSRRTRAMMLATIGVAIPGLAFAWQAICAPYPGFLSELLQASKKSPARGLEVFGSHVLHMSREFFDFSQTTSDAFRDLENLSRQTILVVLALALWYAIPFSRRRGEHDAPTSEDSPPTAKSDPTVMRETAPSVGTNKGVWRRPLTGEEVRDLLRRFLAYDPAPAAAGRQAYIFGGLNVLLISIATVTLYKLESRILAPHLLLSLLVMLMGTAWRWILCKCVVQTFYLTTFSLIVAANHRERLVTPAAKIAALHSAIAGRIEYEPSSDPWANTVLVPKDWLYPQMLAISPGIGISIVVNYDDMSLPVKSRYVILPAKWVRAQSGYHLRHLTDTPLGPLYLNLDSPDATRDDK
jgi:hypothetical protein